MRSVTWTKEKVYNELYVHILDGLKVQDISDYTGLSVTMVYMLLKKYRLKPPRTIEYLKRRDIRRFGIEEDLD